jgi:hypothetical protein
MTKIVLISGFLLLITAGCSDDAEKTEGTALARVNDEVLTYEELMDQIPPDLKEDISASDLTDIVNDWINSEVLYQRSVAAGYDKKPDVLALIKSKNKEIIARKLVDSEITAQIVVPPYLVDSLYQARRDNYKVGEEKYRVSHILLEDYETASAIYKRLEDGSDFRSLAMDYSKDRQSAPSGGDLGYFTAGQVDKPIAEAVKNMKPGNFSKPVKTSYGYHILMLTDRQEAGSYMDSLEAKGLIRDRLFTQMHAAEFQRVVDSLRTAADIEIYPFPGARENVTQDGQ